MKSYRVKRISLSICVSVLALSIDVIFRNIRNVNFFIFVAVAVASVICLFRLMEAYGDCVRKERKIGLAMMAIGVLIFMYTGWLSLTSFDTLAKASGVPLTFFGLMMYISSFRSKWS